MGRFLLCKTTLVQAWVRDRRHAGRTHPSSPLRARCSRRVCVQLSPAPGGGEPCGRLAGAAEQIKVNSCDGAKIPLAQTCGQCAHELVWARIPDQLAQLGAPTEYAQRIADAAAHAEFQK